MTLGENIRELRKRQGLSQIELAKLLEVRQNTIARWERGKVRPPVEDLPGIAKALGTTLDGLYGLTEVEERSEVAGAAAAVRHVHGSSREAKMRELFEKLPPAEQRLLLKHTEFLLAKVEAAKGE